jgi:hypothetical protein
MLKNAEYQDWSGNFSYAPPLRDIVLNTDDIITVKPTESRGSGPWVSVKMRDGQVLTCKGTVDDFLDGDRR